MADRHWRDRYSRQTMFPGIGEEGQVKLLGSSVTLIGCGALGCSIANLLVRAGLGRIRIIDRDFVEYHNLHRQLLFDEDDVKSRRPKAVAAEMHLRKANSSVEIEGIVADANYTNIERFCRDADVILDGLDNIETRFLINDVALKHRIPWVYGGAVAATGMTMTVIPGQGPCLRCIAPFLPGAGTAPTCETSGIVGTVPALIGSLQATEAIKLIIGEEVNRDIIMADVWQGTFRSIAAKPREGCPACRGSYEFLERRFDIKTTVLCGQSRAVQVVDTRVGEIDLKRLASRLTGAVKISRSSLMLRFTADEYEITVFTDGRAIIRNTIDEAVARELYHQYVGNPV